MQINNKILTTILIVLLINILALGLIRADAFAQAISSTSEKDIDQYQTNIQNVQTKKEEQNNAITQNNLAPVAILQGLNKINAKTSELKVPVGGKVSFGSLSIEAKKCWKSPPDQSPENKILLKIIEIGADGVENTIFYGWMFSSSPSISSLEHPIYDITAISCQFK